MGAHALHFNQNTIGIGLMGDYSNVAPTNAMVSALTTMLTWKCARWGINPLGTDPYVNSQGAHQRVANLRAATHATRARGHGQAMLRACGSPAQDAIRGRLLDRDQCGPSARVREPGQPRRHRASRISRPLLDLRAPRRLLALQPRRRRFSFGDAKFYGSTGARRLNQPIVGMAPTPGGRGYWLVARDGGVFCFGDARFFGSTGAMHLNSPVLGLTPTRTGNGYWLFARDGGIFTFGDAKFFGSTGGRRLNAPIVGMAARPQHDGYWMVAADGGIFTFGHAPFKGSAGGSFHAPCVSITPSTTGNGYALLLSDGSVLPYGDVPYLGGASGRVAGTALGMAGSLKPL
jgi:hypothetical protein